MCNPGPTFKFCTCSGKTLNSTNTWRLSRKNTTQQLDVVGGLTPPPLPEGEANYFSEDGFIVDRLLHDLNNNDVFDFDYNPLDGDRLSVSIGDDISLELTFKDGYFDHSYLDFVEGVGETVKVGDVKYTL